MAQQHLRSLDDAEPSLSSRLSSVRQQHSINTMLPLCKMVAIKVAIDVGLFDCLSKYGEMSVGIEDLGHATKVDTRLLRKLVKSPCSSARALTRES